MNSFISPWVLLFYGLFLFGMGYSSNSWSLELVGLMQVGISVVLFSYRRKLRVFKFNKTMKILNSLALISILVSAALQQLYGTTGPVNLILNVTGFLCFLSAFILTINKLRQMPTPAPIVKDENYYAVKKVGRASWSNSIIPFIFLGYGIFLFVMGLNMDDSISTQSMFINASSQICVAFIFFIAWERIKQSDFKGVLIGLFSLAFMFGMLAFVSFVILHNAKRINNSLLGACIVSLVYASIFIGIKFAKKKKQLKVG